jgi:hypothetical protein
VIKGQFSGKDPDSIGDRHSVSRKVDRFDIRTQYRYMPEQPSKWITDVGGLEIAGCHFMEHWGKECEVISADECDFDIGAFCHDPIEVSCGLYAGESATQNNDLCFSHFQVVFVQDLPQI